MTEPDPGTSDQGIVAEIARIRALSLSEIRILWRRTFKRSDVPAGLSKRLLIFTLAWHLQERVHGGHDPATIKLLDRYARGSNGKEQRRFRQGTVLVREYQGARHTVTVAREGFIWQEKAYPTLSVIARQITGTNWNGPRFFGLRQAKERPAGASEVRP
jgi:hypothetical protein